MKVFYHGDADGKCAGYLVKINRLGDLYPTEFIEADYSMKFPIETIKPQEWVYIVDFSIQPDEMRALLAITQNVVWIDHHKTAIEKYNDFDLAIEGLRVDGIAGCMLTYLYLTHGIDQAKVEHSLSFGNLEPWIEKAPYYVKLIADWDVWTFKYGDQTRFFQAAINSYDAHPEKEFWHRLDLWIDEEQAVIKEGEAMTRFRDGWAKDYLRKFGFVTEFEGLNCIALNIQHCNSEYFKSVSPIEFDAFIAFSYNGDLFKVSMYAAKQDVDVSEICKKYGGGGHKGAAGFAAERLPFKKYRERQYTPMIEKYLDNPQEIVEQLKFCEYKSSEGGKLEMNVAFQALEKLVQ